MIRFGRTGVCLAVLATAAFGGVGSTHGSLPDSGAGGPVLTGVELVPPPGGDTLVSVTPTFIIRAVGIEPENRPITLRLQVSLTPGFNLPLALDTSIIADTIPVTVRRALPAGSRIHVRAIARAVSGESVTSGVIQRVVPQWLTLVYPDDPNGVTLDTPLPRFVWRSAQIEGPAAPWTYDLEIRNVRSGERTFYANLTDTVFSLRAPLELNTSYRWAVTARNRVESVRVESSGSFVVINPAVPLVTLLYQNFPNPFPTATSSSTCVWFDLHVPDRVRLDVFDLSGRHVSNIIPGPRGISQYPAGRHGRVAGGATATGCNGDIQWDGRGTNGEVVTAGVYLLRLQAGGVQSVKKIVFRGLP